MASVASELKAERKKRNISLAQIAADTRISLHYLESLEEGRYGELPGGMYNRAFLRAYCESIHLDQREIIKRYEAEISPPIEKLPKPKLPITEHRSSFKFSPILIWSLMLVISATGLFFSREWIFEIFSPYFSHKPSPGVPLDPVPQLKESDAAESLTGNALASSDPAATSSSITAEHFASPPFSPSSLKPSGQTAAVSGASGAISPLHSSAASLRLELAATEECWISVDRDGRTVFRRTLEPGEIQSLSAVEKFFLIVGNAGGLHLKINGKPAKQLGKSGEVIRLLINEHNFSDLIDPAAG
jgi:cytoskeleton protein RodZ